MSCWRVLLISICLPSFVWAQTRGACCAGLTGTCVDDRLFVQCRTGDQQWHPGMLCSEIGCTANLGACCSVLDGHCVDYLSFANCEGAEAIWYQGLLCSDIECHALFGACCNHRTGECAVDLDEIECIGPYRRFEPAQTCAFSCAPGSIWYVDQNATGPVHDGASWCDAFLSLSDALSASDTGDIIRVAAGLYLPRPSNPLSPQNATFKIPSGVEVVGGFAGCGEVDPDRRDLRSNSTILSCDLLADDEPPFKNRGDNCYHVVTFDNSSSETVLDGARVIGGYASGATLFNGDVGAGILVISGAPVLRRCTIAGNAAARNGAGAAFLGSNTQIENSLFVGNRSGVDGGAMYANGSSELHARFCTLSANTAVMKGGGIALDSSAMMDVSNTILWENSAGDTNTSQFSIVPSATLSVNYSCIQGLGDSFPGIENSALDPMFVDSFGLDGQVGTVDDNFHLSFGSPCIDSGNPLIKSPASITDRDGAKRVLCARADRGCFEFGAGDVNCDGVIDLMDVAGFQLCFTTTGGTIPEPRCASFLLDPDEDVDPLDFRAFFAMLNHSP